MITIDLFYAPVCEGIDAALQKLSAVMEKMDVKCRLELHSLSTHEEALKWKVNGFPTIRINGKDIEGEGDASRSDGIVCKTYRDGEKTLNAPSKEMIVRAINREVSDPTICWCKGVKKSLIENALKQGAKTFKDIQRMTGASTGKECEVKSPAGKCCSPFVIEIIRSWKDKESAVSDGGGT